MRFTLSLLISSNFMAVKRWVFSFFLVPSLSFITLFLIFGLAISVLPSFRHPNFRFDLKFPEPLLMILMFLTLGLWIR